MVGEDGAPVARLKDKLKVFGGYYSKLYESLGSPEEDMAQFLGNLDMVMLSECHRHHLDSEITYLEIERAIQQVNLGKSPGLDSLTIQFYRTFKDLLIPYLHNLFIYCLN